MWSHKEASRKTQANFHDTIIYSVNNTTHIDNQY
jgi:hypothetical protein